MTLIERLAQGEILVLDGATGTELEVRGAPQTSDAAWADCSATHPEIVCAVHEDYIRAGADIITTNTYSTGPHVLRQMGRDEVIAPWNIASVALARKAVAQAAPDREILIAGSASAYGNGAMC
ncbi:MAG: homocysteine S-methyltransferase family protein [Alphaproteobacteria bacterium]|jgi:methionine synthase I (cobalamin-dependent)|nr:homocysteine S-methyltransferase family protein [Rhodospirillaceae bacterium]MDG2481040.1 homocysteine S-methyltransferase family protein [Alphaproteobacteria bacterium]MBT6203499.1 homocysteine S-methyltransferase family protein [Rhodospirillaceae bacterium]MBT6509587.1 homocysteine S-methyltransferase family protein [Rhodospirillaceae bacterium]MBT7612095.1 homocysteine S-methyltransferase family protein [Rhodospirillaceae bacterium]